MKLVKKYWFLLFLLFLIVILLILKIKYSNQIQIKESVNNNGSSGLIKENNNENRVVTEAEEEKKEEDILENETKISPTPTKKNIVQSNKSNENYFTTSDGETINADDYREDSLGEEVDVDSLDVLLPYSGEYFTATSLSDNGYLNISIKNESDFDKAKEELGKWLEDNNTNFDETICVYYFE